SRTRATLTGPSTSQDASYMRLSIGSPQARLPVAYLQMSGASSPSGISHRGRSRDAKHRPDNGVHLSKGFVLFSRLVEGDEPKVWGPTAGPSPGAAAAKTPRRALAGGAGRPAGASRLNGQHSGRRHHGR